MGSTENTTDPKPARRIALGVTGLGSVWAGLFRLGQLWPNFTPVGGLALFAGAKLKLWRAFALILGVMALSDLFLWCAFGKRPFDAWVYAAFAAYVLMGRLLLKKGRLWRVPLVTVLASLLFFVVTNFGVWVGAGLYPHTLAGLATCYAAALPFIGDGGGTPFFFGTVAGDLTCSVLFFGLHAAVVFVLRRRKASQPV